jgi:hypothetical protein
MLDGPAFTRLARGNGIKIQQALEGGEGIKRRRRQLNISRFLSQDPNPRTSPVRKIKWLLTNSIWGLPLGQTKTKEN